MPELSCAVLSFRGCIHTWTWFTRKSKDNARLERIIRNRTDFWVDREAVYKNRASAHYPGQPAVPQQLGSRLCAAGLALRRRTHRAAQQLRARTGLKHRDRGLLCCLSVRTCLWNSNHASRGKTNPYVTGSRKSAEWAPLVSGSHVHYPTARAVPWDLKRAVRCLHQWQRAQLVAPVSGPSGRSDVGFGGGRDGVVRLELDIWFSEAWWVFLVSVKAAQDELLRFG